MNRFLVPLIAITCLLLLAACDITPGPAVGPPTETPIPSPTKLPPTPTKAPPTATPLPTATPKVELSPGMSIVIGGELRTRSGPSSKSEMQGFVADHQVVEIASRVQGENWLVGSQTWVTAFPSWATEWFKLSDGTYVYGAFVFILQKGEVSPLEPAPNGEKKWIDVNLKTQTAKAMVGDKAVFTAPISSGQAPFITPTGDFAVQPDGRVAVEKMTATQAGYDSTQAQYDVERVLYTQYFDQHGDALHLNYWRPHSVFGKMATSHGCVGLELHEAQYLWLFAQAGTPVVIHS